VLLQNKDHILYHPGGRNDPPFGKGNGFGPEYNIGFDKYFGFSGQVVQTVGHLNGFADGLQGFFITNDGNQIFLHPCSPSSLQISLIG
jgi:hypothetical protein